MTGAVRISRGLFDDAAFADEPLTEREAFLWLIFEASFKEREKRVGTVVVRLQRGQVAASTRFMAQAWKWSEARVRRYLSRLRDRGMVQCVADAGVTVITLCSYDKYQSGGRVGDAPATRGVTRSRRSSDAPSDAPETQLNYGEYKENHHTPNAPDAPLRRPATQQRRTADANEDKGEIMDLGSGVGRERESDPPPDETGTMAEYEAILAGAGIDWTKDIQGKWLGSTQRWIVQRWRDLGLSQQDILATIAESGPRSGGPPGTLAYFDQAMQRAAGRKTAPPLEPISDHGARNERPRRETRESRAEADALAFLSGAGLGGAG